MAGTQSSRWENHVRERGMHMGIRQRDIFPEGDARDTNELPRAHADTGNLQDLPLEGPHRWERQDLLQPRVETVPQVELQLVGLELLAT
jgi:hypothetical protein